MNDKFDRASAMTKEKVDNAVDAVNDKVEEIVHRDR